MADNLSRRLGREIAAYRKRAGLSQEDLAEKVRMWATNISRIENGKSITSLDVLDRIAKALGITVPELFSFMPVNSAKDETIADVVRDLRRRTPAEVETVRDLVRVLFKSRR